MSTKHKVYLAGPGVFLKKAKEYGAELRLLCEAAGLEGSYPLDNEIDGISGRPLAEAIFQANVDLINAASAVVAEISPFRGPNMDPGTAWEIGYATAKGLPIFIWTRDARTILERTRELSPGETVGGMHYDQKGMHIENFDLIENLMIAAPADRVFKSAEEAIAACAKLLGTKEI